MSHERVPAKLTAPVSKKEPKRKFRILQLEERIAPRCHTNPHGKHVGGCGNGGNGGGGTIAT